MKYLCATIVILASIVSALAFAQLVLLKPIVGIVGLPIVIAVTALSIFWLIKLNKKPTKHDHQQKTKKPDKNDTGHVVAPEKGKQASDKTGMSEKTANKYGQHCNDKQNTDKSNNYKYDIDCSHCEHSHYIRHDNWRGRIKPWIKRLSKIYRGCGTSSLMLFWNISFLLYLYFWYSPEYKASWLLPQNTQNILSGNCWIWI